MYLQRNETIHGTRTDIWRTQVIGQGVFQRAGDGADWVSFNGRITVADSVNVGGFKAAGKHSLLRLFRLRLTVH